MRYMCMQWLLSRGDLRWGAIHSLAVLPGREYAVAMPLIDWLDSSEGQNWLNDRHAPIQWSSGFWADIVLDYSCKCSDSATTWNHCYAGVRWNPEKTRLSPDSDHLAAENHATIHLPRWMTRSCRGPIPDRRGTCRMLA